MKLPQQYRPRPPSPSSPPRLLTAELFTLMAGTPRSADALTTEAYDDLYTAGARWCPEDLLDL